MPTDYAKLREQTLGSGLDEEAVTVNTRALIDKVLARYSGEWTTLRELIQNAADASATKVTIRFETTPSPTVPAPSTADPSASLRHTLLHHTLKTLLVTNNGQPFAESDWSRLKRIAEGNPDETKIGAFGVGFYSVFADCETPFVTSGDQTMAFYWKGNSLFTRRGKVSQDNASRDTCFLLDYRSTGSPVPPLMSICQFLSTSLTFVGLDSIELWLDGWNLLALTKKSAPPTPVTIPSEVNPKTKAGLMKIAAVEHQNSQIDGKWMNAVIWDRKQTSQDAQPESQPSQSLRSFFSRFASAASSATANSRKAAKEEEAFQQKLLADLAAFSSASVFLRVSTVSVQTNVPKQLAAELERATKKPPPKKTRLAILTSSYDETAASLLSSTGVGSSKSSEIFASVLPSKNGRIFIGFPTAQTTGLLAHISAPSVIPTVERENIDLNARYVRDWNYEMLRVAGIACRVAYTTSMADLTAALRQRIATSGSKAPKKDDIDAIIPSAIHTLVQYTYQESTPSSQVGQIIEEAFWTCNQRASIDILSTRGVLPSVNVRLATEDLSFVDGIPVIRNEVADKASGFLNKLQEYGLLTEITTRDIKKELESQAISESQLIELLRWSSRKLGQQQLDTAAVRTLFDGTVVNLDSNANLYPGPVLLLGAVTTYPTASRIPAELPMPAETIPFKYIKTIPREDLERFGWNELQLVPWLRYLIAKDGSLGPDRSLTSSPNFANQVLPVVSKSWDALSQSSKQTVIDLLSTRTVIPTKTGMKTPGQAYFASVRLFDDLPTVQGLQGVKEKFLSAIGVRKTIELSVVSDRLLSPSDSSQTKKWSHVELVKYLVSVRNDIPSQDIEKLRKTPIFQAEEGSGGKSSKLFCASDLFEPSTIYRDLGLPLIYWPDTLRHTSPEATFLASIGLRQYPSVPELVNIMSKSAAARSPKLFDDALRYLINEFHRNNYRMFPMKSVETAFLPVQGRDLSHLATPAGCFTNQSCSILGYDILRSDLHDHALSLGVSQDPAIANAADRLLKEPPRTKNDAKALFGYFAGRLNEIGPSGNLAEKLGESLIVPIRVSGGDKAKVRMASPRSCYLGDSQTYGDIFDFVDFGPEANAFLFKIGAKHEPSALEIAHMTVREPARLFSTLGSDRYLKLLRRLAENVKGLKTDKALWSNLQTAACLVAVREVVVTEKTDLLSDEALDYEEEGLIREYCLASAPKIVAVDDFTSFGLFRDRLVAAPQEEALEAFYVALGTPWVSSLVQMDQSMGPQLKDQSSAEGLQKLVIERCRLFLHDHTPEAVRHDARWMEQTLVVKAVNSLNLRRTLRGHAASYTEKLTAALHRETKKDATLYVTAKYDLYEVSRALMSLLLKRPKQQDYLALEMIMASDLRRLRTKGYNVDRILRQKAAEARVVEAERQRQLQEEQERIANTPREQQNQTKGAGLAPQLLDQGAPPPYAPGESENAALLPEKIPSMPGAFDAVPVPPSPGSDRGPKRKSTFFSNLGKQLGLGTGRDDSSSLPDLSNMQGSTNVPQLQNGALRPQQGDGTRHATSAEQINQRLNSAIQASRAHDSGTMFSPPRTESVREQSTYCDSKPAQDLTLARVSNSGIKVFMPNKMPAELRSGYLDASGAAIESFGVLLLDLAAVFQLHPRTLHIFYDNAASCIAFNNNGSLFCNARFFIDLHWAKFNSPGGLGKSDAAIYWWMTLCHELAHNLVQEHSADHGFYTESFATQYFARIVDKCKQYQLHGSGQA